MPIALHHLSFALFVCLAVPFAAGARASEAFVFGDMKVHPLVDAGGDRNPAEILVDFPAERLAKALPSGKDKASILAYVVQFPDRTVLFDSGMGKAAGGKVLDSLEEAGLSPEDIDVVVITHMHFDHIGGLAANGKPIYPNAGILLAKQERDWWLDGARAGSRYADGSDKARTALAAYPGKVETFAFGKEILPGVTAVAAVGHTPGHTIYDLKSGGGRFLIVGDIMHVADVQFPFPEVAVTYDVDQPTAVEARKAVLKLAAAENLPIAGMHLPLPGVWKVAAKGDGYEKIAVK